MNRQGDSHGDSHGDRDSDIAATADATELARAFDGSFAAVARVAASDDERLLAIRVGGHAYAVRLRDVTGLLADRKIVHLPTRMPAFLGMVGLRNEIAPVYSLGALLGYDALVDRPRWLLLVGAGPLFGLAFDEFDGHRQVARAAVSSRQGGDGLVALVPESVRLGDVQCGLISVAALTETIRARIARNAPTKER
jgi:chemotaxis signal transduction protein